MSFPPIVLISKVPNVRNSILPQIPYFLTGVNHTKQGEGIGLVDFPDSSPNFLCVASVLIDDVWSNRFSFWFSCFCMMMGVWGALIQPPIVCTKNFGVEFVVAFPPHILICNCCAIIFFWNQPCPLFVLIGRKKPVFFHAAPENFRSFRIQWRISHVHYGFSHLTSFKNTAWLDESTWKPSSSTNGAGCF